MGNRAFVWATAIAAFAAMSCGRAERDSSDDMRTSSKTSALSVTHGPDESLVLTESAFHERVSDSKHISC